MMSPLLVMFLSLASMRPSVSEQPCDEASGTCAAGGALVQRMIVDKTPTPCLKTYDDALVKEAAIAHTENASTDNEVPELLMLLGGSGAGKGTLIRKLKGHGLNVSDFVFHGLDEYLIYLPEFVKSVSDPKAVYRDAADDCYGGAIAIAKAAQIDIIARRQHVIYEETGKNLKRILDRVLPPFESAGYRITAVLVDNHPDIGKLRAIDRFQKEGRYAPDDYIEGTFKNVPENFNALLGTGRVHEAAYCDNSCMRKGDGATPAQAAHMSDCLACWPSDVAPPTSDLPSSNSRRLVSEAAFEQEAPRYLNEAARYVPA